jgi:hypothetical protein
MLHTFVDTVTIYNSTDKLCIDRQS